MEFLLVVIALIVLALNKFAFLDPDFGWHLFLGKEMVTKKELISNLVGYGQLSNVKLTDHEWLSDVFLYLGYNKLGWLFICIVFLGISILTFYLLYKVCLKKGVSPGVAIVAIFLALFPYSIIYGVRVQVLIFLGIAIIFSIYTFISPFYKRLGLYFVLFMIGNNFHGGFLTLIYIPLLLELNIKHLKDIKDKAVLMSLIKKGGLILSVLIVAILLNANGLRYFDVVWDMLKNRSYLDQIAEWRPIYAYPVVWKEIIFVLATAIFLFTVNHYWKRLFINEALLILLSLYLGIKSVRFFPIFMLILIPYMSLSISDFGLLTKLKSRTFLVASFLLLSLFCVMKFSWPINLKGDIFDSSGEYPKNALEYISKNYSDKTVLNPYVWGGYQIWTHPELPVLIDGRGPQTTLRKSSLLDEYSKFYDESDQVIISQLDQYQIKVVLLKKEKPQQLPKIDNFFAEVFLNDVEKNLIRKPENKLEIYLNNQAEWQRAYEDDVSVLYIN